MLEQIAHLQRELLAAPPEIVMPAAAVLFMVLLRLMIAGPGVTGGLDGEALEAEARHWINDRIEQHADVLAEAYAAGGYSEGDPDELSPGFCKTVESFIAEVLLRDPDGDDLDIDLRVAVREFVVLHRARLYQDAATRARDHLAGAASA